MKHKYSSARVIVDTANSERDYFLPLSYAQSEYEAGRLSLIHAYAAEWTYYDPSKKHFYQRLPRCAQA